MRQSPLKHVRQRWGLNWQPRRAGVAGSAAAAAASAMALGRLLQGKGSAATRSSVTCVAGFSAAAVVAGAAWGNTWSPAGLHCSATEATAAADEEFPFEDTQAIQELQGMLVDSGTAGAPLGLLQRCCRAAANDVEKAFAQAQSIVRWRLNEGIDKILDDPEVVANEHWHMQLLRYGLPGRDRRGRSVMLEAIGRCDMQHLEDVARTRKGDVVRLHIALCERLLSGASPQAASLSDLPQREPGFVAVLDMSGLSFRHNPMSYPYLLNALRDLSQINARFYPEAVERIFLVNTPSLFFALWLVICPFVSRSSGVQVEMLPEGDFRSLVEECGRSCLPVQLGGLLPPDTAPYQI